MNFTEYQSSVLQDVQDCIKQRNCQPVLLAGSGLSMRYFGAPTWSDLLKGCVEACPGFSKPFGYYNQESGNNYLRLASSLVDGFAEWAWEGKSNSFPPEILSDDYPRDYYVKHFVSDLLDDLTPMKIRHLEADAVTEIAALKEIRPHSVITTNYDQFLSKVFPDYTPIIGTDILGADSLSVGEIFQIHGSTTDPSSLVLTNEDYERFAEKKKFIAAKLLTLFSEHPLLIVGYSVNDDNIKELFADIDLALGSPGTLLDNIYYLEFVNGVQAQTTFQTEKLIPVSSERSVRVKLIQAEKFGWVYTAFKAPDFMEPISPKILRAFMARAKQLTRTDLPRQKVEADFELLAERVESQEKFASLLGITVVDEAAQLTAVYPWTATQLGKKLGYSGWQKMYQLIVKLKDATDVDIRRFDNKYHRSQKYGTNTIHFFSPACKALLEKVRDNEEVDPNWLELEATASLEDT